MRVLVGMSGGVDSSVSAYLLKKQGYEVEGVTLSLIDENETAIRDAKDVCKSLDIKHNTLDLKDEFNSCVIMNFINEYKNKKTPNPCIECNKYIKFGKMYEYAINNGFDYVSTGHYAKVEYSELYKRYVLKRADNKEKDQSYVLYNLKLEQLSHILFPLNNFKSKDEIRKIAKDNNLSIHSKSDSQDICFIPNGDYKKYLEDNHSFKVSEGNIIYNSEILGKHNGLYKYTIGQRKGLGISYEEPLYVIGFKDNDLLVGKYEDLYIKEFKVKNYNLLLIDELVEPIKVDVKTRYKQELHSATIYKEDDYIKVVYDDKQPSVTPGQSAVFYVNDMVLGGGIIV